MWQPDVTGWKRRGTNPSASRSSGMKDKAGADGGDDKRARSLANLTR